MLTYPNIDPVIFSIGGFALRWYSLAYMAGILLGWKYIHAIENRATKPLLSKDQLDNVMIWAIIGIILGGRMGYILFYNFPYFSSHPESIFKIWEGGMSFHGGLLGVLIAFAIFAKKHHISWLSLMDRIACAAPIGLFFGRIANFINGELYGRTTGSWAGMIFPYSDGTPRHPSQLYEAALEGALLFIILWAVIRFKSAIEYAGLCGGIFLCGYGTSRFIVEYFREPDSQLGFIFMQLSMGQLLSVPMIIIGLWFILRAKKQTLDTTHEPA